VGEGKKRFHLAPYLHVKDERERARERWREVFLGMFLNIRERFFYEFYK
jgi:hypothetical protein